MIHEWHIKEEGKGKINFDHVNLVCAQNGYVGIRNLKKVYPTNPSRLNQAQILMLIQGKEIMSNQETHQQIKREQRMT